MREGILYQITSDYFCAGVVVEDRVTVTAPILHYMLGWTLDRVKAYCFKKGFTISRIAVDKAAQLTLV